MVSLLEVARIYARKSHLVYQGNLNFGIINHYLDPLLDKELLVKHGDFYRTTDKGLRFIESFNSALEVLQ